MSVLLLTVNQMFANQLQISINFNWPHGGLALCTCHKETIKRIHLNTVETCKVNEVYLEMREH